MSKTVFRFVKQVASLAQKHSDAGLLKVSNPTGNGYAGWKHVVLHSFRVHEEHSFAAMVDRASEMNRIRALLRLPLFGFPCPSALWRSFRRTPMSVRRNFLKRYSTLLDRCGHAAIDATFFTREQASPHYLRRIDRSVETLKVTLLIDTTEQSILDVHCAAKWPNDAKIGPKLTRRNVDQIDSLADDKGYDSAAFRAELRDSGVRPLIKHRHYRPVDHAHNARLNDDRYNQRSQTESVNSAIKSSLVESVSTRLWFHQFREIVLATSVQNVKQAIKP